MTVTVIEACRHGRPKSEGPCCFCVLPPPKEVVEFLAVAGVVIGLNVLLSHAASVSEAIGQATGELIAELQK